MDVEILLEKYMVSRRGKWMLEPICKNANEKIVDFLIETAIDDFHEFPDRAETSTQAIIENLGFSGFKSAADFLNSILAKQGLKRYHAAARRGMENFSSVSGYTLEDIFDLSIPDYEMSDMAEKTFEYEGNIITVSVSSTLDIVIKDEVGKHYEKFDFLSSRVLSKFIQELTDTVEMLSGRFSEAIVTNRRWAFSTFDDVVLSHPLMRKFAENLMLAVYNEYNKPKRIFYYVLGGFMDIKNEKVELSRTDKIGIINPMDIDERIREEIKHKCPTILKQLTRNIYTPNELEIGQPYVTRFKHYLVDFVSFCDTLMAKGYQFAVAENKSNRTFLRICPPLNLAAKIVYSAPENKRLIKNTRIPKILFYSLDGLKKKNGRYVIERTPPLFIEKVDKYFFSDVLKDIYELI